MDSLEDVDLAKALNFSNTLTFMRTIEEELAGVILAAKAAPASSKTHRCTFPPLKPRYATLLQLAATRFGLKITVKGWGDERRILVEASSESSLPVIQCTDLLPPGQQGLADRLESAARASRVVETKDEKSTAAVAPYKAEEPIDSVMMESEMSAGGPASKRRSASPDVVRPRANAMVKEPVAASKQKSRAGGMHGWSDDEGDRSDDDWLAKRHKASTAAGRSARGRGFEPGGGETQAVASAGDDDSVECQLQKDYTRYAIDPEDTWSPQRKPYAELDGRNWEFSGAWSFDPDEGEHREEVVHTSASSDSSPRGVAVWRVEHAKGGDFTVVLADGHPGQARRWLEGGGGGRGEEPFVLEFKLDNSQKCWHYRFGRCSNRQSWKALPWSNQHRTSFWLANFPGEDGKQHFYAGLDEFPERRFFFARVRLKPRCLGFGPPAESSRGTQAFFVRDIAVFGRLSLLPSPWASRDHFVQLPSTSSSEALKACQEARLGATVVSVFQLSRSEAALLVCQSPEAAADVSAALPGSIVLRSSQWLWPTDEHDGLSAVQKHKDSMNECWSKLDVEATRELAIFEEHTARKTRHLEGMRIARTSATRMILGNLKGDAPLPKPPSAGV